MAEIVEMAPLEPYRNMLGRRRPVIIPVVEIVPPAEVMSSVTVTESHVRAAHVRKLLRTREVPVAAPITGVTSVGDVLKTTTPVPVSFVRDAASWALVIVPDPVP